MELPFEPFSDLRISTMTVIVELSFFIRPMELAMQLCANEPSLQTQTEMQKSAFKKLSYPAGTIIHVQYNSFWRGIRRMRTKGRKKKNDFINVVTVDVFTEKRRVNVMIFKNGKVKMAGCESTNDAVYVITRLIGSSAPEEYTMTFLNEMINISFSFPFCINKMGINNVFNEIRTDKYFSFYEQTGPQYVNLKVYSETSKRLCVVITVTTVDGVQHRTLSVEERDFKRPPKTSFTIFDKRVIMSGVDKQTMSDVYADFLRVINDNKLSVRVVRTPPCSPVSSERDYGSSWDDI